MSTSRTAGGLLPLLRRLRGERRSSVAARRDDALIETAQAGAPAAPPESPETAELRAARAEGRLIVTEYPYHPRCRPIETAAGGARLADRLRQEEERYAATLRGIARHAEALRRIPREERDPGAPFWANDWFPPFDGAALYGLIAEHAPRRYVEVGSGISTRFARQAVRDLGLHTRIVSVDPHPHTAIDALCDEVVRSPMEEVERGFWEGIGPDDLLFVDNSHRSFPNSDVTVFFAEVLPALRPGTVWGLHDILLPWDYPDEWRGRFYNEQYLLLAYLTGGADGDEILLPTRWATAEPRLHGILGPLWQDGAPFEGIGMHGSTFWMRRGGRAAGV